MKTYHKRYNSTLKCNDIEYFPISIRNNKFPLNPKNFSFSESSKRGLLSRTDNSLGQIETFENVKYKLKSPQIGLFSFGIWGRIYYKDDSPIYKKITKEDVKKYIEIEDIIYGDKKKDLGA